MRIYIYTVNMSISTDCCAKNFFYRRFSVFPRYQLSLEGKPMFSPFVNIYSIKTLLLLAHRTSFCKFQSAYKNNRPL